MLNHPWRNLARWIHVVRNVLSGRSRGADRPYDSDAGCDEQKKAKSNARAIVRDPDVAVSD